MSAAVAALIAAGGGPRIQLANATDTDVTISPVEAFVSYALNANGNIETSAGVIGVWIIPQIQMALFECRATLNSGSISFGVTGTWLSLATTQSWEILRSTVGTTAASLTIEIRRTGTSTILASAVVGLSATVEI